MILNVEQIPATFDILNAIPFDILTAIVTFIASYVVLKFRVKSLEKTNSSQETKITLMEKSITNNKDNFYRTREKDIKELDRKREDLKDEIHELNMKTTKIHVIVQTIKENIDNCSYCKKT